MRCSANFFLYDVVQLQTAAMQSYTKMDSNLKSIHISVRVSIIYMNVAMYLMHCNKEYFS